MQLFEKLRWITSRSDGKLIHTVWTILNFSHSNKFLIRQSERVYLPGRPEIELQFFEH